MGLTVYGVQEMGGTPFYCHISEYLRTIIYKIPSCNIQEEYFASSVVKESAAFNASVVTNPLRYVLEEKFTDQHIVDTNFGEALQKACGTDKNESPRNVYVVLQFKEDLGSFPVLDGQCIRLEDKGKDELFIIDCIDAPAPKPAERTRCVNIVLTAIRAAFEETSGLDKILDLSCYKTDQGECLYELKFEVSAHATLVSPLTPDDLTARSETSRLLATRIEAGLESGRTESLTPTVDDFGSRLEELIEALQLDPSNDSAYLRLWYLRLWDRVDIFRNSFGRRRPKELNDFGLKEERNHRHSIAHRGVEKVDGDMFRSLQKKVFHFFKGHF